MGDQRETPSSILSFTKSTARNTLQHPLLTVIRKSPDSSNSRGELRLRYPISQKSSRELVFNYIDRLLKSAIRSKLFSAAITVLIIVTENRTYTSLFNRLHTFLINKE